MQHELPNTLARLITSPYRTPHVIDCTAAHVAQVLLGVTKKDTGTSPDSDAVRFYALNQMIALLFQNFTPNEVLPEWASQIVTTYEKELEDQTQKMLWYIFLITSREARHLKNPGFMSDASIYTAGFRTYQSKVQDNSSDESINSWLKYAPDDPMTVFSYAMTHQFDHGSYSSGYGGKKWGHVARAMQMLCWGKFTAEMFVDTGYTLAHNGGPIFNKSMIYGMYTDKLIKLLDVQRGGMVCEGVVSGEIKNWFSIQGYLELSTMIADVRKHLGGIGDKIDWKHVEKCGSINKYDHMVKGTPEPKASAPGTPKMPAASKVQAPAESKQEMVAVGDKLHPVLSTFEPFPKEYVKVYNRKVTL